MKRALQINLRRRSPDLIVGSLDDPYLYRWTLVRWRGWQLALHCILRDDDDRALHDHIGNNGSLILWRGYYEVLMHDWELTQKPGPMGRWRYPLIPYFRHAEMPHRLVLKHPKRPTWTLWLRGPKVRRWGMHTDWGWVDFDLYESAYLPMVKALRASPLHSDGFSAMNWPFLQYCQKCKRFHDVTKLCEKPVAPCSRCSHEVAYSCRLCVPAPCRCLCHWIAQ